MKGKIKDFIISHKICLLVIGLVIIFDLVFLFSPTYINVFSPSATGSIYPSALLKPDTKYSQEFTSGVNRLSGVDIRFATYGAENTAGSINIELSHHGDIITSQVVALRDIPDNSTYKLTFEEISESKNQKYKLTISYLDYQDGNSLCFFLVGDGTHQENGQDFPATIYLSANGQNKDTLRLIWWNILIVIACVAIMSITPQSNTAATGHKHAASKQRKGAYEKSR